MKEIKELFKVKTGYPNYLISNLGKVYMLNKLGSRGLIRLSNPIEMTYRISKGYRRVGLYGNNHKQKNFKVSRLVAESFIPNPNHLSLVMHLDNNKLNDKFNNLKWGTYKENSEQMVKENRQNSPTMERNSAYKFTPKKCKKIKLMLKLGLKLKRICEINNISRKQVYRIRDNKTKASRLC